MKSARVSTFLLIMLSPFALAQLPDQVLDQQLETITNELDDVIEMVDDSVNQEVDAVVDQLEGATREMDVVADSLSDELDAVESAVQSLGEVDDQLEAQLRNQDLLPGTDLDEILAKPVADTLALLPDLLPIQDRAGKTVFVEVKVEQNWYAVEREWLLILDEKSKVNFAALKADILEQRQFPELGMRMIRFRVPAELDSMRALQQHLPAELHGHLDRNHIYIPQGKAPAAELATPAAQDSLQSACDLPLKIGMIDTAIDTQHSAFAQRRIFTNNFIEASIDAPRLHGTAVAGLLVGKTQQRESLLPAASLYSASVFYSRTEQAQGATMMSLVRALNWLAAEKVSVINMSLAGPENKILSSVIQKLIASGTAIIAAAGNEGPAAPPVYPAAYDGVIAVTAVDQQARNYRWANQGNYIDFAALGVGVVTARANGGWVKESGTSMAAPVVSALFACELAQQHTYQNALKNLTGRAIDLGEKGRDPVFGFGLLQTQAQQ